MSPISGGDPRGVFERVAELAARQEAANSAQSADAQALDEKRLLALDLSGPAKRVAASIFRQVTKQVAHSKDGAVSLRFSVDTERSSTRSYGEISEDFGARRIAKHLGLDARRKRKLTELVSAQLTDLLAGLYRDSGEPKPEIFLSRMPSGLAFDVKVRSGSLEFKLSDCDRVLFSDLETPATPGDAKYSRLVDSFTERSRQTVEKEARERAAKQAAAEAERARLDGINLETPANEIAQRIFDKLLQLMETQTNRGKRWVRVCYSPTHLSLWEELNTSYKGKLPKFDFESDFGTKRVRRTLDLDLSRARDLSQEVKAALDRLAFGLWDPSQKSNPEFTVTGYNSVRNRYLNDYCGDGFLVDLSW